MSESKLLARLLEAEERIAALEAIIAACIFQDGCLAADQGVDSFTSMASDGIGYELHDMGTQNSKRRAILERALRLMLDSLPGERATAGHAPSGAPTD